MIAYAKVQTWSMLLETGLIGKILGERGGAIARYEGEEGENARSKSQVKGTSRKSNGTTHQFPRALRTPLLRMALRVKLYALSHPHR
jgi:hypothetical protein